MLLMAAYNNRRILSPHKLEADCADEDWLRRRHDDNAFNNVTRIEDVAFDVDLRVDGEGRNEIPKRREHPLLLLSRRREDANEEQIQKTR